MQKAYVLHYRNYRETSLLVDLLTQYAGYISVIARGAKRPKSSFRGLLQPFMPLEVFWRGKGELPTLNSAESCQAPINLSNSRLFSGFYLNELLMRVLHKHSPCESIFLLYDNALNLLNSNCSEEVILRKFEFQLLRELGYELQLTYEAHSNTPVKHDEVYFYTPNHGFTLVTSSVTKQRRNAIFSGKNLLLMAQNKFTDSEVAFDAKRLIRLALQPFLGHKSIKSRELYYA